MFRQASLRPLSACTLDGIRRSCLRSSRMRISGNPCHCPGHHRCRRINLRPCPAQPVDKGRADQTEEKRWVKKTDLDLAAGKSHWDLGTVTKGQGVGSSNQAQKADALNVQMSQLVMHKCVSIPGGMSLPVLWADGHSE